MQTTSKESSVWVGGTRKASRGWLPARGDTDGDGGRRCRISAVCRVDVGWMSGGRRGAKGRDGAPEKGRGSQSKNDDLPFACSGDPRIPPYFPMA